MSAATTVLLPAAPKGRRARRLRSAAALAICLVLLSGLTGCYAPLHSWGIPARTLPDSFRSPIMSGAAQLNFSALTMPAQADYLLGPQDMLEVTVHGLYPGNQVVPVRVEVMASGEIYLPMVGPVRVGGMNLVEAQNVITKAYEPEYIRDARVNVTLVVKSTTSVVVLGEVTQPGVYQLPKYETDVAHAIAMAKGLTQDAGLNIEVHRRIPPDQAQRAELLEQLRMAEPGSAVTLTPPITPPHVGPEAIPPGAVIQAGGAGAAIGPMRVVKIPLRGFPTEPFSADDVVLHAGDVVIVPSRTNEVFYVVGKLSPTNFVRFSIGARERDLGAGFVLPRDRDVDVVTAVAMAGYIDPIDSPTTVTVHRTGADGQPLLIHVDLIKARYDRRETILVHAGDIIYLNPDAAWWTRRTFDRIVPSLLSLSYRKLIGLSGQGSN